MEKKPIAYDYEAQRWVSGPDAVPLLRKQLGEQLALLTGPKARDFAKFTGIVDIAAAIRDLRLELSNLNP